MVIRRLLLFVSALALVAAACGTDTADLPVNPNPGAEPPGIAGACLEGEPDCNDTLEPGEVPDDLPPSDVGSGALVDGGLTVSEALATDATGILAVQGFIVDDGSTARLCEALAESMPPQCGGASVPVDGYENAEIGPLASAQGGTWTDQSVVIFGDIIDGVLMVNTTVDG